jgi:predicted glycoside hydrolase/deacetylase ChbG (UPF0249 family)
MCRDASTASTVAFWLSTLERRAVSAELRAQSTAVDARAYRLTHVDSHHDVHNDPAIGPIVNTLARELRVP